MPWTPLYTDLNYTDFLGDSLTTINGNFESIDTYLSNLTSVYFPQFLLRVNNLSELVPTASTARDNLEVGTIWNKSEKAGAQAWVVFNGASYTNVSGENRCNIISSFNVSKVVRIQTGVYDIYYSSNLEYIGPVVGNSNNVATILIDYQSVGVYPSVSKCRVVNVDIRQGPGLFLDSSYINVLSY